MGLGRFELPTPRLSSVCSNQLSYRPQFLFELARIKIPYLCTEVSKNQGTSTLVPSKLDRHALTKPSLVARSIFQEVLLHRPCDALRTKVSLERR